MLFANDLVLIDEMCNQTNDRLKVFGEIVE